MKKYLLAVLLLAGCQEKPTTLQPIKKDTTVYMIGKIHDTIYIHDTIALKHDTVHHFYYKSPPYNVETHGDNSPAIISDKPVNIKY